jgi:ABC-type antimicrobial peptide transport system permease subunit
MIIGGIVVGVALLAVIIITIVSLTSKKMKCTSTEGKITIMYNDKTITGHTAINITYDLDGQKKIAEEIGIEEYLDEFATWFSTNTDGTCKR